MAALRPHHGNLGLNLFGWHWLAGEGVQLLQNPAQILAGTLTAKLLIQEFNRRWGVVSNQQPRRPFSACSAYSPVPRINQYQPERKVLLICSLLQQLSEIISPPNHLFPVTQ
jgi:hypothetical protein